MYPSIPISQSSTESRNHVSVANAKFQGHEVKSRIEKWIFMMVSKFFGNIRTEHGRKTGEYKF